MEDATFLSKPRKKIRILIISEPATNISGGYYIELSRGEKPSYVPLWQNLSNFFYIEHLQWKKRTYYGFSIFKIYLVDFVEILFNTLKVLCKILKGYYDVIILETPLALESILSMLVLKVKNVPFITMDSRWYNPRSFISLLTWPLHRLIVVNSNIIIVPGTRAYKYWTMVSSIPRQKLKIIRFYYSHLSINSYVCNVAESLRTKFGDKVVILYVGRLIKQKGVRFLIHAFAKLRKEYNNVILIIVGEGEERRFLEELCKKYNMRDSVIFTGAVDRDIKTAYYMISDIVVRPSITSRVPEEWGLVINEAISLGKPVIVSNATGVAYDIVKDGINGYVVPEKSSLALYRALITLVTNKELRIKMGLASKRIFEENFNLNTITQQLEILLCNLALKDVQSLNIDW